LHQRWEQVLRDPVLRELPYRIELNKWGHIEMTPQDSPRHMELASDVVILLRERLGGEGL
jgi:hypothetical protein